MPVMMVYASVAKEMGIAEETVRRVMWEMRRGR
jgi:predicted transcriptional regulator